MVVAREVTVVAGTTVVVEEEDDDELVATSNVVGGGVTARLFPPFEQDGRSATAVTRPVATSRVVLGLGVRTIPDDLRLGAAEQPAHVGQKSPQQVTHRIGRSGPPVGGELRK